MDIKVINQKGESQGKINLPNDFEIGSDATVLRAVQYYQNIARSSIAHTKNRGDVRGSGIKPWKQKGTGNARAGSRRSPLWRGGGITFGPRSTDNFATRLPKKMRKLAMNAALSDKIANNKLFVVDSISLDDTKTKSAVLILNSLGIQKTALIITENGAIDQELAFRNIPYVKVLSSSQLNLISVMSVDTLIFTQKAFLAILKINEEEVTEVKKDKKPVLKTTKKVSA